MSQPVEEYPTNVMTRQPPSSRTNGSFGPVFAVLAVIVVVSAVACVLGRMCSKRSHRKKEGGHHPSKGGGHPNKGGKPSQGLPKEWESRTKPNFNVSNGDIEFGFDKKMASSKGAKNGGGKAKPPHQNGGHKPEIRFSDNV